MADSKIPLSDLPAGVPGAYDKVAGVDTSTGASRLFPMPQTGVPTAYATRASLPAAGGLTDGTAAWVTNDPNPLLNGTWSVQSGAWVQSADRVTGLEGSVASLGARTTALEGAVASIPAAANAYTDSAVAPLIVEIMSGEGIYWRALSNPTQRFQAIWSEYNKSVWHIGGGVVVDATGATLKLVEQELVFTVKLTQANQTFVYPTRNATVPGQNATIDWGDGTTTEHSDYSISHAYTGAIGSEFQVRVRGNPVHFDFGGGNATRRTSAPMLKSIDKNTLPKTMPLFSVYSCINLEYVGPGAFASWTGTASIDGNGFRFPIQNPLATFHKDAFVGSGQITSIREMFQQNSGDPARAPLPAGLLDPLVNVTNARDAFRLYASPLPPGLLDKMVMLEDVSTMFYAARMASIDSRLFRNQTNLKNVTQCFRLAGTVVADAFLLYTDMNQGAPALVAGCFTGANAMTNLASVPSAWKSL